MFIKLGPRFIPVHTIVSATERKIDNKYVVDVETTSDRFTVGEGDWRREMSNLPHKMVPAQPGTYVLSTCSEPFEVFKEPVIAWALTADGVMAAVTNNGINDGGNGDEPILFPTGEVRSALASWDSFALYEKQQRESDGVQTTADAPS